MLSESKFILIIGELDMSDGLETEFGSGLAIEASEPSDWDKVERLLLEMSRVG